MGQHTVMPQWLQIEMTCKCIVTLSYQVMSVKDPEQQSQLNWNRILPIETLEFSITILRHFPQTGSNKG